MRAICIDIDNVIAATDVVMRQVIRDCSKDNVDLQYEDVVCFDYWLCRDARGRRFQQSEWGDIHRTFTDKPLGEIRPVNGVRLYLQELKAKYKLHLATSRLPAGKQRTTRWLHDHQIPYDALHFVRHGEKHLIDEHFMAAIDDDREQGYAFHACGISVFLSAHPWNRVGKYSPLIRCATWNEITARLLHADA